MPQPRTPAVPPFAPEGSITLASALDLFGRVFDPSWTGDEIRAETRLEPSDEELKMRAFAAVTREASGAPGVEFENEFRTEADIFQELREERDCDFAPRQRWRAAAEPLRSLFHRGILQATAFAADGRSLPVPQHVWGARWAMRLFDNGGFLDFQDSIIRFPEQSRMDEHAIVLVDHKTFEDVIRHPERMTAIRPEISTVGFESADSYRTGAPGRPTVSHLVVAEFHDRLRRGEVEPEVGAESEALAQWVKEHHPNAPNLGAPAIENKIRALHRRSRKDTK